MASLHGGFKFRRYLGQPGAESAALSLPGRVVIPMLQGFGVPLTPSVKPGDKVKAGQVIGRDDGTVSSPVHASVSGMVMAVSDITVDGRKVPAVTIDGDGSTESPRLDGHSTDWQRLAPEKLEELLYLSGVTGLAREGFPTKFRSSVIGPADVRHLIVLIPGADAFNVRPEVLVPDPDRFTAGVGILARVLPRARVHIAASGNAASVLHTLPRTDGWTYQALSDKYPQDATELLVMRALGTDFPFGYAAANIGVVIADAGAVAAAWDAVVGGKPITERTIALSGPGFELPTHMRVRVGTPVERVVDGRLKSVPVRLVRNSLLAGIEVTDRSQPVLRTDSQIIAALAGAERKPFAFARPGLHTDSFSRSFVPAWLSTGIVANTNRNGDERPCIQCGWCARVCPVRIIPHLITRMATRLGVSEALLNLNVFNCIDCNLCTFVCPSKLPLAQQIFVAKEQLLEIGCDNSSCVLKKFDVRGIEEYKGVKSIR